MSLGLMGQAFHLCHRSVTGRPTLRQRVQEVYQFSVSSATQLCLTLCDPMDCSMPGFLSLTISQSLLKLMSIESVMPSNHLILCHPLLPPSIFPIIRVFSNELVLHISWPKYWSFSFSISPSNEYSGLISFRMDWLHLLAIQGTLKSLLQHHSSILRHSALFRVQVSHPYMSTGKAIALTRWTFVGRVMSLLFNMLSKLVIAFSSKEQASFHFMVAVTFCSDFGAPPPPALRQMKFTGHAFGPAPMRGDRAGPIEGEVTTGVSANCFLKASPIHRPLAVSALGRCNLRWGRSFSEGTELVSREQDRGSPLGQSSVSSKDASLRRCPSLDLAPSLVSTQVTAGF